jgi:hypothetical protein
MDLFNVNTEVVIFKSNGGVPFGVGVLVRETESGPTLGWPFKVKSVPDLEIFE